MKHQQCSKNFLKLFCNQVKCVTAKVNNFFLFNERSRDRTIETWDRIKLICSCELNIELRIGKHSADKVWMSIMERNNVLSFWFVYLLLCPFNNNLVEGYITHWNSRGPFGCKLKRSGYFLLKLIHFLKFMTWYCPFTMCAAAASFNFSAPYR